MKNWIKIASGHDLAIPESDLERVLPVVEAVDAAFQPLKEQLADDLDPAPIFRAAEDRE